MAEDLQPDPSPTGGAPKPPSAVLPDPVEPFRTRARRVAVLADISRLTPYLAGY